jgi:Regulator of cell morphogenesis and NO signaling
MTFHDKSLGELALSIPRASALFRKYDMDYCCGGRQTLARAAERCGANVEEIAAELAKLSQQPLEKRLAYRAVGGNHRSYRGALP